MCEIWRNKFGTDQGEEDAKRERERRKGKKVKSVLQEAKIARYER